MEKDGLIVATVIAAGIIVLAAHNVYRNARRRRIEGRSYTAEPVRPVRSLSDTSRFLNKAYEFKDTLRDSLDSLSYKGFKFVWGYVLPPEIGPVRNFLRKMLIYKGDSLIDTLIYWDAYQPPVRLFDLDADGDMEIIIQNNTGGASCCEKMAIFEIKHGRLVKTTDLQGSDGLLTDIKDLDGDGYPEIIIRNSSLECFDATCVACVPDFTSYVHYKNGRLIDVTKRFPWFVRAELDSFKQKFFEWKKKGYQAYTRRGELDDVVKGKTVAIYVHYYLLGKPDAGIRFIDKNLPEASKWIRDKSPEIDSIMQHWLDKQGSYGIEYPL